MYNKLVMKDKKEQTIYNKIEFDEKTAEPVIVEVPANSVPDTSEKEVKPKAAQKTGYKNSYGKQIELSTYTKNRFKYNEETSVNKRQKIFKNVFYVLFIVLIVGVLAYTAYNDFGSGKELPSWSDVVGVLSSCWFYIIFALIALFFCYFFKGIKLSMFCKEMTGKWHFKTCMETGVIGLYYNNVTPLAVGGQPFEIYHLSKHGVHGGVASSLPIATFFLNQFAFVVVGIISLVLFGSNALNIPEELINVVPSSVISVIAIIGLVLCIFIPSLTVIFSIFPRIGYRLVGLVIGIGGKLRILKNPRLTGMRTLKTVVHNSKCIKKMATNVPVFILAFLASICEHLALWSIAYFSLRFFGYDLIEVNGFTEWLQIMQLCSILYAAISFIPTPGNSGAADLSFYLLFETGVAAGLAFPAMLTWRFLSFYSTIVIGFVFTSIKRRADKKAELKQ